MQGFWSQVITLAVILQIALVTGKALIQNNQQVGHQLGQNLQNAGNAQRRDGYDYPAPIDHQGVIDQGHYNGHIDEHHGHNEHHDSHDHHDPGYWKKKLIWKPGFKKIWKRGKTQTHKLVWKKIYKPVWVKTLQWKEAWKQISVSDSKDIWLPGVEKIWKPVWISEWFPTPDHHHEHAHESHGWDRSDNNAAASQQTAAVNLATQLTPPQ